MLSNLSSFNRSTHLKTAISTYIGSQVMKNHEKEELYRQFKVLDKDGDGMLD